MYKYIKISLITILLVSTLQAQSLSFYFENDVVNGEDRHYTNGTSFIYVSDTYKDGFLNKIPSLYGDTPNSNFGIAYSQLAFTPSDLKTKAKIIGDIPYAGVINIDFFIYKWNDLFFHEYMLTLGMVGPSTKTEEFQKSFHNITGNTKPQGWDNQLKDDFLYNFSYAFGHKSYKKTFNYGKLDMNNSFRIDAGNYTRDVILSSMIRYGHAFPDNFNTVGRFIGSNENKQLNIKREEYNKIAWSVSYGIAYTYTDFFYINDHDKSYNLNKIRETITHIISLDTYLDKYLLSFNFKSNEFIFKNSDKDAKESWGGISLIYLF